MRRNYGEPKRIWPEPFSERHPWDQREVVGLFNFRHFVESARSLCDQQCCDSDNIFCLSIWSAASYRRRNSDRAIILGSQMERSVALTAGRGALSGCGISLRG